MKRLDNVALQAHILQLQHEQRRLQQELVYVLGSRSWRITAPLRFLAEKGRNLRSRWNRSVPHAVQPADVSLPPAGLARLARDWKNGVSTISLPREGKRISLWTARQGNAFFLEIAHLLACGLEDAGIPCTSFVVDSLEDCLRLEDGSSDIRLIIAPHEFFHFIRGAESWPLEGARLWLLNSEQKHTVWFSKARAYFHKADLILDMDSATAVLLRSQGLPAEHLPLLKSTSCRLFDGFDPIPDSPAVEGIPKDMRQCSCAVDPLTEPLADRPLDCCFFGVAGERRSHFFARNAALFADMQAYLRLEDRNIPLVYGENSSLSTQAVSSIVRRSKISLNVHQSEHPYFEWHRIVLQGIWQGTVVVSEPCTESYPFRPDEDYISASLEDMPAVLEFLLRSDEGRAWAERIRRHAWRTLTENSLAQRWQSIMTRYALAEEVL